jgi:hypothetical protein
MSEQPETQAPVKIEVRRLERLETTSSNPKNS